MRIIILMLYAALGYALYVFMRGYFSSVGSGKPKGKAYGQSSTKSDAKSSSEKMVECSECGAMVPESHSKNSLKAGKTLHFCGDDCMGKFGES